MNEFERKYQYLDGIVDLTAKVRNALLSQSDRLDLKDVPGGAMAVYLPAEVRDLLRVQMAWLSLPGELDEATAKEWLAVMPQAQDAGSPTSTKAEPMKLSPPRARLEVIPYKPDSATLADNPPSLSPGKMADPAQWWPPRVASGLSPATMKDTPERSGVYHAKRIFLKPPAQSPLPSRAPHAFESDWDACAHMLAQLEDTAAQTQKTLDEHDVQRLLAVINAPGSVWAPPSCQARRAQWQQRLEPLNQRRSTSAQTFEVPVADLPDLAALLKDRLITSCNRDAQGGWHPKSPDQLRLVQALACWMREGTGDDGVAGREAVGRLLLAHQAGLNQEIKLVHGSTPLELPSAELLDELMSPMAQVHLCIKGGAAEVDRWGRSLQALPMRTWQLDSTETLARLMQEQQTSVRVLDLSSIGPTLDARDLQVLEQARERLTNLAIIRLPVGAPADVLGSDWESVEDGTGLEFKPKGRLDGLEALDEAVAAWKGNFLGSRMAMRRKASQPEGYMLLRFAALLALEAKEAPEVGRQLRYLLNRCADDDLMLKAAADVMADGELVGEALPDVLARAHQVAVNADQAGGRNGAAAAVIGPRAVETDEQDSRLDSSV
ncbi:hypothetical protein [Roseateles sp. YR242]|uniref:hypothetical protein n=1 Tax=Roseateles sp. YR242 TaxID=1855305 RepID=UPI000B84BFFB|nr:hypothetical protein [Roseateles sp. YR242]